MRIEPALPVLAGPRTPGLAAAPDQLDFAALLGASDPAAAADMDLAATVLDPATALGAAAVLNPATVPGAAALQPAAFLGSATVLGRATAVGPATVPHLVAPAEAAAATALLSEPPGPRRDEDRSLRAFAFGVFGVFPPGAADVAADDVASPVAAPAMQPSAAGGAAAEDIGALPAPAADPRAVAALVLEAAAGADAPPEAAAAMAIAVAVSGSPEPDRFDNVAPPIVAMRERRAEGPPAAAEAALASPAWPEHAQAQPGSVRLVVTDGEGGPAIVAAAAGLDPVGEAMARARLSAVAAEHGLALETIQLNGSPGVAPVRGGDRNGHRAR